MTGCFIFLDVPCGYIKVFCKHMRKYDKIIVYTGHLLNNFL